MASRRNILPALAASARSAGSNTSSSYAVDQFNSIAILVDMQSVSGTPTSYQLVAKLQYSPSTGGSDWYDLPDASITLTGVGVQMTPSLDLGVARRVRVNYTLSFVGGSSPTATFAVHISPAEQAPSAAVQKVSLYDRLDEYDKITSLPFGHNVTVISTATTTVIKALPGTIRDIRVIGGTLGNVTVYDNSAASGTVLVPTVTPAAGQILLSDAAFTTGCTIVTAAATLIVVTWR